MQIVSTYLQTKHDPDPVIWIPYKNRVRAFQHIIHVAAVNMQAFQDWLANPTLMITKIPKP